LTGGSLLVSDDLPALPPDRLALAQSLLPVIGQRAQVLDLFETDFPEMLRLDLEGPEGPWYLLAKFNWGSSPKDLTFSTTEYHLPAKDFWLREFWTGQVGLLRPDQPLSFAKVPAHGVAAVAVRPVTPSRPVYLGSDLHLSQGLEIADWQWEPDKKALEIKFALGHKGPGAITLSLPWQPTGVTCSEAPCRIEDLGDGIFTVQLADFDQQVLKIH
jgi:hypothetical protein